ncbi:multidrug efflux pump subunit AcrB [Halobacillus andaensis]|nr:multidrug efflux pump subunit AcrB [Halobacillus andaensis]
MKLETIPDIESPEIIANTTFPGATLKEVIEGVLFR